MASSVVVVGLRRGRKELGWLVGRAQWRLAGGALTLELLRGTKEIVHHDNNRGLHRIDKLFVTFIAPHPPEPHPPFPHPPPPLLQQQGDGGEGWGQQVWILITGGGGGQQGDGGGQQQHLGWQQQHDCDCCWQQHGLGGQTWMLTGGLEMKI